MGGKLQALWDRYRELNPDDPTRKELQIEINKVETWMISKGYKSGGITQWFENGISPNYPHHSGVVFFQDIYMVADLNKEGIVYNADKSIHICDKCK